MAFLISVDCTGAAISKPMKASKVCMYTVQIFHIYTFNQSDGATNWSPSYLDWLTLDFETFFLDRMAAVLVAAGYTVTPPSNVELPPFSDSMDVVPTLESMCEGASEKRKAEIAKMLDKVLNYVKDKAKFKLHPAVVCVAIYKLAIMLGKIEEKEEVTAKQWRRILENRYSINISSGIAKYNIKRPVSKVFKKAILEAYNYISTHYPGWVKKKNLPPIYH